MVDQENKRINRKTIKEILKPPYVTDDLFNPDEGYCIIKYTFFDVFSRMKEGVIMNWMKKAMEEKWDRDFGGTCPHCGKKINQEERNGNYDGQIS